MDKNEIVDVGETINTDTQVVTETNEPEAPPQQVETPEAKVARLQRELRRAKQRLGIEEETEAPKKEVRPFTLDKADKAYLIANGIKGTDEFELVTDFVKNTGKDIEDLVDNKYFNSELSLVRANRESKMASDAASGSPRSNNSARDTVDYWIAKGQLPPPYMTQLRRDVVNSRLKMETDTNKFTDNPLVGGK